METAGVNNPKTQETKTRPNIEEKNAFLKNAKMELQKIINAVGSEHKGSTDIMQGMIDEFSNDEPNVNKLLGLGDNYVKINGFGQNPTKEIGDLNKKLYGYIENFK